MLNVPKLKERAFSLWRRYKTDEREYREIAEALGMSTARLNQVCSWINRIRKSQTKG